MNNLFFLLRHVFGFLSILAIGQIATASALDDTMTMPQAAEKFRSLCEHVQRYYVKKKKPHELLEGALKGMLQNLDPHSNYLSEHEYKDFISNTAGQYGGFGMEILVNKGIINVIQVYSNSPAARAGITSGMKIIGVDDKPIVGLTPDEVKRLLWGEKGSQATLQVLTQEGGRKHLSVTREEIKIEPIKAEIINHVGVIKVRTFNEQTTKKMRAALLNFNKQIGQALQGVIIDLRDNGGGLLEEAISMVDLFLDHGDIVFVKGQENKISYAARAKPTKTVARHTPLLVLVNENSASAPEIVAGALQDNKRAIIVGTKTFGKGSVQSIMPIDKDALKLTTGLYATPSGRLIQKDGIYPDIVVEQLSNITRTENTDNLSEAKLPKALEGEKKETLTKQKLIIKNKKEEITTVNIADYQLIRAIDMVRVLAYSNKWPLKKRSDRGT